MIRDEMIITIKQMDETLHELFGMIGLNADPSIYEVARDIASCKACGVEYHLPQYPEIKVDGSSVKWDNINNTKIEVQEGQGDV